MKTVESPADKTIAENEVGKRSESDRTWQTAGDRVLLYLRCLSFPAPQALELSLSALKTAQRSLSLGSGNSPVVEAMNALHQLISDQGPETLHRKRYPGTRCEYIIPLSPPLHRRPMVPEGL
jgi:hypothetical protein